MHPPRCRPCRHLARTPGSDSSAGLPLLGLTTQQPTRPGLPHKAHGVVNPVFRARRAKRCLPATNLSPVAQNAAPARTQTTASNKSSEWGNSAARNQPSQSSALPATPADRVNPGDTAASPTIASGSPQLPVAAPTGQPAARNSQSRLPPKPPAASTCTHRKTHTTQAAFSTRRPMRPSSNANPTTKTRISCLVQTDL